MMFDFTKRAKRVINEYAQQEAKRLGHDMIGPEHILLGLLREEDSVAIKILKNLNIELSELRREIERRSKQQGTTLLIDISLNPDRYQKIIDYAKEEARRLKHNYVGTEHILLALLRDNNNTAGTALASFNVNYSVIKGEVLRILGVAASGTASSRMRYSSSTPAKSRTPTLDEFARDLTQLAREKKLLPVIGRNEETQRVIQVLCRKTKNNPVLIGEAGVGKTAIVEGLAERIVEHSVPDVLFKKRVIVLDLAGLVAGTKYRGEFEDRLKKIMREIQNSSDVIIFIDELHMLIGAGAAEGAIDAANMLKPALARGEIQCIGATTLTEFRKYIEKDSALERRFQSILVKEPSQKEAVIILKGLKQSFEKHHKVRYSDEVLEIAVRLAERHIHDRYLPDKAIDVIDEAGARARLSHFSRPDDILIMEEAVRTLVQRKDDMVKAQEYEKAAQIRDDVSEQKELLEARLVKWQERIAEHFVDITAEDIYAVMSLWTGIPLSSIEEKEASRLLNMEKELQKRIVGQNEAIKQLARSVRRSRTGLGDKQKPAGSFIFLGPTGVGKTELARVVADFLFNDPKKLFRLDMSEFMEPHSISKIIGSPPGYVGYEDAGRLCEFVRRNPYCVILFDEIEKAHPDVFNLLLQILDDASLTDAHGRRVDFMETFIIMTSNLGAREMQKGTTLGFAGDDTHRKDIIQSKVLEELRRFFSPEFLNRVDEVITFQKLKIKDIRNIVEIMIDQMNERFFEKKLCIKLDNKANSYVAYHGFDDKNGARPLRRTLQKEIEDYLAVDLLEKAIEEPTEFLISASNECHSLADAKKTKLTFKRQIWNGYTALLKQKQLQLLEHQEELMSHRFRPKVLSLPNKNKPKAKEKSHEKRPSSSSPRRSSS